MPPVRREEGVMKSILVHLRGSPADIGALNAAWRIGRPFAAHLDCLRVVPILADVAMATLRVGDSRGAAEAVELQRVVANKATEAASRNYLALCRRENLPPVQTPPASQASAAWREKTAVTWMFSLPRRARTIWSWWPRPDPTGLLRTKWGASSSKAANPCFWRRREGPSGPNRNVAIAWEDTGRGTACRYNSHAHSVQSKTVILRTPTKKKNAFQW